MNSTPALMTQVLLALVPGLLAMTMLFGIGVLLNVIVATAAAAAFELLVLQIRPQQGSLADGSALVTGALIGLAVPPTCPLWMVIVGVGFAIVLAKHAYGGLGKNLFNPAMVGFCVLIIAFPLTMARWQDPVSTLPISQLVAVKLGNVLPDAYSMATPLDAFRHRGTSTSQEFWAGPVQAVFQPWLICNSLFLAGGLFLLFRRICRWQAPLGMLSSLFLLSLLFYDGGSSAGLGAPMLHLFSGATMLGAFFIVTDPVTSPESQGGQFLFGIGVGSLTFLIRSAGAYPEGLAFAILLMNAATPLINIGWARR